MATFIAGAVTLALVMSMEKRRRDSKLQEQTQPTD